MKGNKAALLRSIILILLLLFALVLGIFAIRTCAPQSSPAPENGDPGAPASAVKPHATADPTPVPTPTPQPTPFFHTPAPDEGATAEVFGYRRELEVNGEAAESYTRSVPIAFAAGTDYSKLPGVLTFRGDNYRSGASFGNVNPVEKKLNALWTAQSGSMRKGISADGEGSWTGSGWVGQPLMAQWPKSTKAIMNMYDWAKEDDTLVEVIYATMDGNVYFLDLQTGKPTRDKLVIGMPFKGAGSLDPRGYPILYLGSGEGYNSPEQDTRALIYSLVDFTRLYEFGKREDPFSLRSWHAYDSAPLVDAAADTLVYPGENGVLYTIKLNTRYDEAAGKLSIAPDEMVKYRYGANRTQNRTGKNSYWLGFEGSAAIWDHYFYNSDNAGLLQCIDLNTMDIVWVQDTWDDTNGSPVLEEDPENHTAYLYLGTSLHWKKNSDDHGDIGFFKVDAVTGKVLWTYEKNVATVSGVSGGIQATAVVGREGTSIEGLVIIPIARTPSTSTGMLVALDKATGNEVWTMETKRYAWSSPIALYAEDGAAYIVQFDTRGHVYLVEGRTGKLLDTIQYEDNNFEASPAAFGNVLVVGSRASKIYGIEIQ